MTLAVRNATVRFDSAAAVDGVSLDIADGETLAVLGPSGSGKSTLLRAVAGLNTLSGGTIELDGRDLANVPPHRRGVGLMFQDDALFPHRDVAGNVAFGLRMAGASPGAIAIRLQELLELVGLSGLERRSVGSLSGGERKRVALARALAPSPRLLLLDEPLAALDRALRERLRSDLEDLFERLHQTVLYVTHDVGEAFALGRRVAVMRAGRIVQAAPPDVLWASPADAWVARFVGLANVAEAGTVAVVTRPEAIRFVVDPAGRAVISGAERSGPVVRLRARLDDGTTLEAAAPGLDHPLPGDRVSIEIDPAGVVTVPRGSDL